MRRRTRRALATAALTLAVAGAWYGCVEWPIETPDATAYGTDGPIELADGRQVSVRWTQRGLVERHRDGADAGDDAWSAPKVLYGGPGDDECGVRLSTYRNTVAVVADHPPGCYADSPPEVVVVAVGTGDLDDWDTRRVWHDDGFAWTRFSWSGQRVVFRREDGDGVHELSWRRVIGFTGP
ncbi:hypothetical protein [Streptomyces sp. Z26]|uniref:hypothetical protein n=1 Tax=Streptomyces sp. Z26 TaxID=2500177 RepID=UPI000EF13EA0|nr:hypothetical protein [Streptomyces sp. Z26]RLL68467.1 hypothetical protein D7M15_18305 [Streptomyces sp. Z26]